MNASTQGAVILAAGRGQRTGHARPKAYLKIHNKPMLLYSIEKLIQYQPLNDLVLVINSADKPLLDREILTQLQLPSRISFKVIHGGAERQDSALAGVQASEAHWLFIHDAARPFFPPELLAKLFGAAREYHAAIPTLPVVDSLRRVDANELIAEDVDRNGVHIVQTPQCYERSVLLEALEAAHEQGKYFTDEAAAVLNLVQISAKAVEGSYANFKITSAWDFHLAELIANSPDMLG